MCDDVVERLWDLLTIEDAPAGWGFFDLGVSPMLIVASLIPEVLFGVFLWGLDRVMFKTAVQDEPGGRG